MGSSSKALRDLRLGHRKRGKEMSWTWRGFWRDDPVFRFKNESFFQSGRHKAEERFWVNYIHDDGSYLRPLRSRHSSAASFLHKQNKKDIIEEKKKDEEESEEEGKEEEQIAADEEEFISVGSNEKVGKDVIKRESESKEDSLSSMTCLSCTKCAQPLGWVEKRDMSREWFEQD